MKILGVCGSLRNSSSNSLLMKAAKNELEEYEWLNFDISLLPYFDPDNQFSEQVPRAVLEIRSLAAQADMIFIFSPEYAHGIPGILKNAFEWIFHEHTQKKPVYVVIGSAEGENAKNQLIEILSTMDFQIDEKQILLVKGARSLVNLDGSFRDQALKNRFSKFCKSIQPI